MSTRVTPYLKIDWPILLVLVGALALRLAYLISYSASPDWNLLTVDNYYHHHWAQSIAGGNILGDTTYFRAPFYVYCLAALYALFGDSLWVSRLFGLAIGMVTILFTYLIGRRFFGMIAGLLAAILMAIYPINIYYESELLLDPLFTLLLLAALYHLFRCYGEASRSRSLILGVLVGLAAITRPTALVLVPVFVIALWASMTGVKSRLTHLAYILVGIALLVVPIFVRNVKIAGDPTLISSQGGINLYIGNNESADGLSAVMPEPLGYNWRLQDITYVAEKAEGRTLKPGEISAYWTHRAEDWMADHPAAALRLYVKKLYFSVANREVSNDRDLGSFFARSPLLHYVPVCFGLIFALAVGGAVAGYRRSLEIRVLAWAVAGLVVTNSLFFVNSRFRLPIVPVLCLLSALALIELPAVLRDRRRGLVALAGSVVIAGVVSWAPLFTVPRGFDTQGLLTQGRYQYSEGRFPEALQTWRKAAELDDHFPETNLDIGACYFRMGAADSAMYYFRKEMILNPGRPKAYANLASLYLVSNRYADARTLLDSALTRQPYDENSNILSIRAWAQDSIVPPAAAGEAIRNSLARAPDNLNVLNEAGAALIHRGFFAEADSLLTRGTIMAPPPIEMDDNAFDREFVHTPQRFAQHKGKTYTLLGFVKGLEGDFDRSVLISRKAIELDSTAADPYVNLVSGFLSRGESREADSLLREITARFPNDPRVRMLRNRLGK